MKNRNFPKNTPSEFGLLIDNLKLQTTDNLIVMKKSANTLAEHFF